MRIDRRQVEHIARLARLSLSEDEKTSLEGHLSGILDYVEKLSEIDTSHVPPTSHVLDVSNAAREDSITPSFPVDDILSNAPDRSGDFYRVPKIIE